MFVQKRHESCLLPSAEAGLKWVNQRKEISSRKLWAQQRNGQSRSPLGDLHNKWMYSFVPCTTCVQVHVFSKKLCFPKNSCFLWENTFILVVHYNKRPIILKGWYMQIKDRMAKRNKTINSFKSHLIRKWTCEPPWMNVVTKPLDLRSALWEQYNFYAYHFYSSRAFILTLWLNVFFNMQVHNIPLFYEFTYEIKLASLFRGEFLQEAE